MAQATLAILIEQPAYTEKSAELGQRLNLPVITELSPTLHYVLCYHADRLELRQVNTNLKPLFIDFFSNAANYRREHGGGRGQAIARAVGLKKNFTPFVLDFTAGLGSDAFVLAALGCHVHMLERSPIIGALLEDGLFRARQNPLFNTRKMQLTIMDARDYLLQLPVNHYPDAIYIDPMFPPRTKSALVKKEMRMLSDILGKDEDAEQLLHAALICAKHRVIVKRSKLAPALSHIKPDIIQSGKSTRFDIYLTKQ